MAEQTTSVIVVDAPASEVMAVIADFPAYPEWAQGMQHAEVLETDSEGRGTKVAFELEAAPIKDSYTLSYVWKGDREVTWGLLEGRMLKAMEGAYVLRPSGGATEVTYRLAVELSIPMIGMLRRKAEKIIIDAALKGLKKRVESHG